MLNLKIIFFDMKLSLMLLTTFMTVIIAFIIMTYSPQIFR